MNRPEPIELENNLGPDAVTGEINRVPWMAYDVDEMDLYIAEKDKEIAELKKKLMPCLNGDCILTCEVVEKYGKENAELKAKLEDAKASHYAEMVDAGMRERRLRRALWLLKARYFWILMVYASDLAKVANPSIIHKSNFLQNPTPRCMEEYQHEAELYDNARIKSLNKAEEY